MITPESMTKLRMMVPKSLGYDIIDALYKLNLFHVKEHIKADEKDLEKGKPLMRAEEISEALLALRAIKNELHIDAHAENVEAASFTRVELRKITDEIQKLHEDNKNLLISKKSLQKEIRKTEQVLKIVQGLDRLGVFKTGSLKHTSFTVGKIKKDTDIAKLKEQKHTLIKEYSLGEETLLVSFMKKQEHDKIDLLYKELGISKILVKNYESYTIKNLETQISKKRSEYQKVTKKIMEMTQTKTKFLIKNERILEEEVKKAELSLDFAHTQKSFIATGFVPTTKVSKVKEQLTSTTKGAIVFEEPELAKKEAVPVKLNNKEPIQSFEALVKLYELPKANEADPSFLIFLTFPLFFGIMLGDIGYGLITLFLFMWIKKKWPVTKQFMHIFMIASIFTILFGGVFGEVLGYEHVSVETGEKLCNVGICLHKEVIESHGHEYVVYDFPRLLNRVHGTMKIGDFEILSILAIGIMIGFVHINLGLLIGFFNMWKAHGFMHAFLEKLSWYIMQAGVFITILTLTKTLPLRVWVGPIIFGVSCVLLYLGEGPKGIIEIPAIFSNMLSYVRLGAVGLASVGLAVVVNENLAKPFIELGGFYLIPAILVMIIGHTVNIGLGVLGPFLHGIRLHYVEYFSKFFTGGGKPFKPFGLETIGGR